MSDLHPSSSMVSCRKHDHPHDCCSDNRTANDRKQQHSNWIYRHFSHFCQSTTLHGWVFLVDRPMLLFWRAFWVVVVVLSFAAAAFFLYYAISDFMMFKVQTTYGSERGQWKDVHFPAVTLCNINQARRSFFRAMGLRAGSARSGGGHSMVDHAAEQPLIDFIYRGTENPQHLDFVEQMLANRTVLRGGFLMRELKLRYGSMRKAVEAFAGGHYAEWAKNGEGAKELTAASMFRQASVQDVGHSYVLQLSYKGTFLPLDRFALLHAFFQTDFGFCIHVRPEVFYEFQGDFSFSSLLDSESHMSTPNIKLGRQNGLSLLLDTETFDYGYSPQDGEGFKLSVHHYLDHPNMQLSQADVGPGFETRVAVTPTLTKTTDQCKSRFPPEERHCYLDNEFHFVWLDPESYRYSFDNCLIAAAFDRVHDRCNCTTGPKGFNCNGTGLACEKNIMQKLGTFDRAINTLAGNRTMKCHSACDDETFDLQVTSARFPNLNLFLADIGTFCIVFRKIKVLCRQDHKREVLIEQYGNICKLVKKNVDTVCVSGEVLIVEEFLPNYAPQSSAAGASMSIGDDKELHAIVFQYARTNLARLNVFIRDTTLTSIVRDEKQPIIWFIANIGGLTGLAMGCSLVTGVEIFYFLFVWLLRGLGVKTKEEERIENKRRSERIRRRLLAAANRKSEKQKSKTNTDVVEHN